MIIAAPFGTLNEVKQDSVLARRRNMRKYQYGYMKAMKCKPYGIIAEGKEKGFRVVMYNGRNYIIK